MNRRTLLKSIAAIPVIGSMGEASAMAAPNGKVPFIPKLIAKHASTTIDRRLGGNIRRGVIQMHGRKGATCHAFDRVMTVEHLYEAFGFRVGWDGSTFEMVGEAILAAEKLADRILERAGRDGIVISYEMPTHASPFDSEKFSQRASDWTNDLLAHGLLFRTAGADKWDVTVAVEMMVAIGKKA